MVRDTPQNYTDLALLQGVGRWDTGRAVTYGQVFACEAPGARDGALGIRGPPGRATA